MPPCFVTDSKYDMALGVWGKVSDDKKMFGHIAAEHTSLLSAFMGK